MVWHNIIKLAEKEKIMKMCAAIGMITCVPVVWWIAPKLKKGKVNIEKENTFEIKDEYKIYNK